MTEPQILYSGAIVTRKDAKASGLKRYFTGIPCPHGHVCQRYTSGTACAECLIQKRRANPGANYAGVKAWRLANPEKWAAQSKRYFVKYPEKSRERVDRHNLKHRDKLLPKYAAQARERRKANPEAEKIKQLRWKARRELAMAEIAGRPRPSRCEICKGGPGGVVFDHCHNTGMFRGWICDRCNKTLGMVKDSSKLLKKLAAYIEATNVETDIERAEFSSDEGLFGAGSLVSN